VKVKICGVRTPRDAELVARSGADLAGLNFVPESRRFLRAQAAAEVRGALGDVTPVGVFRDAPIDEILRLVDALDLSWVQLHGRESIATLERVAARCSVIRALPIEDADRPEVEEMARWTSAFLVDGPVPGSGVAVDCSRLCRARFEGRPLFLAGGLRPENVADLVRRARPDGVDVATGVTHDGAIDGALVASFVERARGALGGLVS
jgi:phosphoribosylanthranilate isomerase